MEKYNSWTIIEHCKTEKYGERKVICRCDCGTEKKLCLKSVKYGKSKSCGCLRYSSRPVNYDENSIIEKYKELKTIKDTSRHFVMSDTKISNILKKNGVELYASMRKDPEYVRKRLINKVVNYRRRRIERDPLYKAKHRLRTLMTQKFMKKKYTKESKCFDILGIEWEGFKTYIESKFKDGMSWENYGEWEYDHIIPVSIANNVDELYKLNRYTNFQPLWKEENKIKSNKIIQ
jgi:hypothetical protein